MEEAVFVKMEEAAPKVEDGSERAEVGLSGTMTKDLTSEVEKGLKELDSTSDHPGSPSMGTGTVRKCGCGPREGKRSDSFTRVREVSASNSPQPGVVPSPRRTT